MKKKVKAWAIVYRDDSVIHSVSITRPELHEQYCCLMKIIKCPITYEVSK